MKLVHRLPLLLALQCFLLIPALTHAQWNEIHVFSKPLNGLWFTARDTGFVCGGYDAPFLAKTTDGGYSWEEITPATVEGPVMAIAFTDASTGFIAWIEGGSGSHVCKTIDGGLTWSDNYSTPPRINTIVFPTAETGYVFPVAMEYANAIKTTDGGETWNDMGFFTAPSPILQIPDASFREPSRGFVVSGEGSVFKTVNGGTGWTLSWHNAAYSLNGIQFTCADTGFAVGELEDCWSGDLCGLLLKTTDGGLTWDETVLPQPCSDIWFAKPDTGYIATYPIMKTTNGGLTWFNDTVNKEAYPSRLFFPTHEIGYAISGSAVLKMDPDVGVGVDPPHAPFTFTVSPVPAKDLITLSFPATGEVIVRAELLDNMGGVVRMLNGVDLPSGGGSFSMDIASVPAGVYFCRVTTGKGVFIKKILILK